MPQNLLRQFVMLGQECQHIYIGRIGGLFFGFLLDRELQLFEQNLRPSCWEDLILKVSPANA